VAITAVTVVLPPSPSPCHSLLLHFLQTFWCWFCQISYQLHGVLCHDCLLNSKCLIGTVQRRLHRWWRQTIQWQCFLCCRWCVETVCHLSLVKTNRRSTESLAASARLSAAIETTRQPRLCRVSDPYCFVKWCWKPISELWSITCHMGSHSVTCRLTQVNSPCHNSSRTGWYSIYLPQRDGRLSWPWCLFRYIQRWFTYAQTVTRLSSNHLIVWS